MILIVEGLDNTGKSTLIKQIRSKILVDPKTISLHCSSPPNNSNAEWSKLHYTQILSEVSRLNQNGWDVILDRSHIGEMVYGPLYRGVKDSTYILDLDKHFLQAQDSYMILLTDSPESLVSRDDGYSPSINIDDLDKITNLFLNAFDKSFIEHKLHYDITDNGGFENLFPTVKEFLNNAKD